MSAVVMVLVSRWTAEPPAERLGGLTYATVTAEHRAASRSSWTKWDVVATATVLLLILAAYVYFSG